MHKCDICGFYMRKPHKIGRKDLVCIQIKVALKKSLHTYMKNQIIEKDFKYLLLDTDQRKRNENSSYRNKDVQC